jgi:hypothetical protein
MPFQPHEDKDMAAGWSSGVGKLPVGRYIAQIKDVSTVKTTDYNDKTKEVEQFKWDCDVQKIGGSGRWESHKVYTGNAFRDPATIKDAKFMPKLHRIVRACGTKIPTSAAEALAWDEQALIGQRFGIHVIADVEDPNVVDIKYVQLPAAQAEAAVAVPEPSPERELAVAGAADNWS